MKKKYLKAVSMFMLLTFLYPIFFPTVALALTGGPSQPEVGGFEPVGTNQMVDLFSGDFNYNIPLLDVGGYPINIAYHAGVGMDQEASWVGLGWSLNPGVVNRAMRGMPDDFRGEKVKKVFNMQDNITWGLKVNPGAEFLGAKSKLLQKVLKNLDMGLYTNNYRGVGYELGYSLSLAKANAIGGTVNMGLRLSFNSQGGLGVDPRLSFATNSKKTEDKDSKAFSVSGLSASVSTGYNTRSGLKALSFSAKTKIKGTIGKVNGDPNTGVVSAGIGSSFPLGVSTYTPGISMSMVNNAVSFNATIGTELFGFHGNGTFTGYKSVQRLYESQKDLSAYGYMYAHKGVEDRNDALMDFNRERDQVFRDDFPHVPMANFTYDVYSASGQGTGGMYRPWRNDLGVLFDNKMTNSNNSKLNIGIEVGPGNAVKVGTDWMPAASDAVASHWPAKEGNRLEEIADFGGKKSSDPEYEAVFFKKSGEKAAIDGTHYASLGKDEVLRMGLKKDNKKKGTGQMTDNMERKYTGSLGVNSVQHGLDRVRRNQHISYLTAEEAAIYGLEKDILSYDDLLLYANSTDYRVMYDQTAIKRYKSSSQVDFEDRRNERKAHHISEVTVTNPDGMRYVYGIPAYNISQQEVTFNIAASNTADATEKQYCEDGLVPYQAGTDNSKENTRGKDHYYNKVDMPAYAHSYLLTAVLSPDYVDLTGDGVSDDDLGTAVRLNYERVTEDYGWRTPYDANKAKYNEGYRSVGHDDKASYVYGKKEVWYLHSIESKTHVAEFVTSLRDDGLGVSNENGAKDASTDNRLRKLDKIMLYSKFERIDAPFDVTPVKTIEFEYDYSLCRGVPNNVDPTASAADEGGKLTLKKIYITYGDSRKGSLSPYEFTYGSDARNPGYNLQDYDRWGGYKPNDCELPNSDAPYTDQMIAQEDANDRAAVWSLEKVKLPSGGEIDIDYEVDDYAYVQDKKAMQMKKILGVGNGPSDFKPGNGNKNLLYDGNRENLFLFFELNEPLSSDAQVRRDYTDGINHMYFKTLMYLKNDSDREYVGGYSEIEDAGLVPGKTNYGWVEISTVNMGGTIVPNQQVNPIARAGWKFLRLNLPQKIYPGSDPEGEDESALKGLISMAKEVGSLFTGTWRMMRTEGFAKKIELGKSYVRLHHPTGKKRGGGLRVKEIRMKDQWAQMGGNYDFDYGTQYNYTMQDPRGGGVISSGVASYEPMIGGEANPFRLPFYGEHKKPLSQNEKVYVEKPFGETLFPSASVGYRQVTVQSITRSNPNAQRTGYAVHEFYTAYDFPVISDRTEVDVVKRKPNFLFKLLKFRTREFMTASQGYKVELNDMHGKPKAQMTYDEAHNRISGVEYAYKTQEGNERRLSNKVDVMNPDGSIEKDVEVGIDYELYFDGRYNYNKSWSGGLNANLDGFVLPIIIPVPVAIIVPIPSYSRQELTFKSISATKVIQRYGVLEKTTAYDEESVVTTYNRLYDKETGETLLTETKNEFQDDLYNFNYPAHIAYDRMGPAYKNVGIELENVEFRDGYATISNAKDYFVKGDELAITNLQAVDNQHVSGSFSQPHERIKLAKGWVLDMEANRILVVNRFGQPIHGAARKVKILRSGRRNQQTASIGGITSMHNPMASGNGSQLELDQSILQTSATEFSDEWAIFNDQIIVEKCGLTGFMKDSMANMLNELIADTLFLFPFKDRTLIPNTDLYVNPAHMDSLDYFDGSSFQKSLNAKTYIKNCFYVEDENCKYVKIQSDTLSHFVQGPFPRTNWYWEGCDDDDTVCVWDHRNYYWLDTARTDTGYTIFLNFGALGDSSGAPNQTEVMPVCQAELSTMGFNSTLDYTEIASFHNARLDQTYAGLNTEDGHFLIDVVTLDNDTFTLRGYTDCMPIKTCWKECDQKPGDILNPYVAGIRGIWRKKRDHVYHTDRTQAPLVASNNNIRVDGQLETYTPFWTEPTGGNTEWTASSDYRWVSPSEVVHYSPPGNMLEVKDALGRSSAEIYGYDRKFVVAVGNNAKHSQIAYDGFEDYDFPFMDCRKDPHWNMLESVLEQPWKAAGDKDSLYWKLDLDFMTTAEIDESLSHSGIASIKVSDNQKHTATTRLYECDESVDYNGPMELYRLNPCDCIGRFAPEPGKYVISVWVHENHDSEVAYEYKDSYLIVDREGSTGSNNHTFTPAGPMIEGWQQIYGEFEITDSDTTVLVSLKVGNIEGGANFDDIRIHPFNSTMKSFVYHPQLLKPMAELDENNFATFYEYDEEGQLIRVKKETTRGVVTLKESRYGKRKNN